MAMECPICLNELTELPLSTFPVKKKCKNENLSISCCTPCGHLFHRACLITYFEYKNVRNCPLCRKFVKSKKLYPVYLDMNKGWLEKLHAFSSASTTSQESSPQATLSRSKSLSALIAFLRRFFPISSAPSYGSRLPTTLTPSPSIPQQLQVAVTINCRSQTGNDVLATSRLRGTVPQTTSATCTCSCSHHYHRSSSS